MKKKWLLTLLAATACIAGALGLTACNEHKHDWSDWSVTETPKAAETGKATRTCNGSGKCDAVDDDKEYTLPDLNSGDYTLTDNTATCTAAGTATYTYNKDGVEVSFTADTPVAEHDWNEWELIDDNKPNLETAGKLTRTCKYEGCTADDSLTEYTLPVLSPTDYTLTNNTATCTAKGTATYTFNRDGINVSFTAESSIVDHDWNEWTVIEDNKPSDTEGKATRTCKYDGCNATENDKEYPLPVLTSEDYTLTDNTATCSAAGTATYTYNKNGVTVSFTADTPIEEHGWSEWTVSEENKPTDTEGGKATRTCKFADCAADESLKEHTLPNLKQGNYTKGDDTATCSATGTMTYTYQKSVTIDFVVSVSFTVETPVKNHDWNEWTIPEGNKPTLETEGKATRTCKFADCAADKSLTEYTLPALTDSKYSITNNSANCLMLGTANYQYQQSGINVTFTAESATTDHKTLIAVGTAKAATCSEDGLSAGAMCADCHTIIVEQERIPAKHTFGNFAPVVGTAETADGETIQTVSQICDVCSKTVIYEYDGVVSDASGTMTSKASALSTGINYVTQTVTNPYLSYAFTTAGKYTIYWVSLSSSVLSINTATLSTTGNAFIDSSNRLQKAQLPADFALEGYLSSGTLTYCVTTPDGNKLSVTANAGDYITLTKESFGASTNYMTLGSFVPVKLTMTVEAGKVLKFRNVMSSSDYSLISINKEPEILLEKGTIAANNYAVNGAAVELAVDADTAGTYTFTAKNGKFELYVNDEKYSDGEKDFFGYVDLRERYLTVTVEDGDVVKIVKVAGRVAENKVTIHAGTVEEPADLEYNVLHTGDNTITLRDTDLATGAYDSEDAGAEATEKFYSFTSVEGGYFKLSVAPGVTVNAVIREDRSHYSTIFQAPQTSGVFYLEAGKTVIIAFVGNKSLGFNVNIVSCEKPVTYLNSNEKIEVTFYSFETIIELTVGDSVPEGTYTLTFEVPQHYLKGAYIYFSVNGEIVVDDKFDNNAINNQYVNPDIAEGANNTVGPNTRDIKDEDYVRTVTLKAGDVIYLATTASTTGIVSITLTPVE